MNKLLGVFTAILVLAGCQPPKGTETGNPSMRVQFSAFAQSTQSVSLCIHQIRFKSVNSEGETGENANVAVGVVTMSPSGTTVADTESVRPGTYRRVDIMVKDSCGNGKSISVTNGSGTFSSNKPLILRFIGEFEFSILAQTLDLEVGPFTAFFDTVTSDAQLENGVETVEGQF
ncbi:MAG: hypothetical protein ABL958_18110 [Bdellovibrionia bacterium]